MAFKIVWSPDALTSYLSIISYLEKIGLNVRLKILFSILRIKFNY
jgi:hypothetical protein